MIDDRSHTYLIKWLPPEFYVGRGTHHVIKCTRPSASENTPTRNYNLVYSRPSPSSTRACSVRYNYAWEYFRREKAWYILSRDACRDLRRMTFTLGSILLLLLLLLYTPVKVQYRKITDTNTTRHEERRKNKNKKTTKKQTDEFNHMNDRFSYCEGTPKVVRMYLIMSALHKSSLQNVLV